MPALATIQPKTARPSQPLGRHCSALGLSVASSRLLGPQPLLSPGPQPRFPSHPPQPPVQVFVQGPPLTLRPVPARRVLASEALSHGHLEPETLLSKKANGNMIPGPTEGRTASLASPELSMPALLSEEGARSARGGLQNGQSVDVEEALVSEPKNGSFSALLGSERHPGPRRSGYCVALPEPSAAVLEQSGAVRPQTGVPPETGIHLHRNWVSVHYRALSWLGGDAVQGERWRPEQPAAALPGAHHSLSAVVREPDSEPSIDHGALSVGEQFLHQCDREDLVELALPLLAQVVTVSEFLLMKDRAEVSLPALPGCPAHGSQAGRAWTPPRNVPVFVLRVFSAFPYRSPGHHPLVALIWAAVYKEFEELHKMVKKMCQDYLRSSAPCSLEINNSKVAESLGITEEFLRKKEIHTDCTPPKCTSQEEDREALEDAGPQKRENETTEGRLALVKRTRREPVPQDTTEYSADGGGLQGPASCAPEASAGFAPGVNGGASHPPEGSPTMPVSELNSSTAQDQVATSSGEKAQEHSSEQDAGDGLGSRALCGTSMALPPGRPGNAEVGSLREVCSPGEVLLPEAAAPPQEKAWSVDVMPAGYAYGTTSEPGPQPSRGGLLGSVVSGEGDVVIVTDTEGPALQAGPPEGVPLETVETEPPQ
ncbi:hypothetical protein J1605_011854 [Eschrichtius robustus]|uniref:DUF4764 domain-containing protein n=1 Tax=Eschrichtius robustus TaxID=9764 RepID=A0AB34GJ46_ESCRO|nr:hypothetical protein J1605_011854 [Eschrichtius robustus]